jgi:hypothetical protein
MMMMMMMPHSATLCHAQSHVKKKSVCTNIQAELWKQMGEKETKIANIVAGLH